MADIVKADLCVIGAGTGGLTAAAAARALGASVMLVEGGRMGGGSLHAGCIPSKALTASAERAHLLRNAAAYGIGGNDLKVNYRQVHEQVRSVVASMAPDDSLERFRALGVDVVEGDGRFVDKRTLAVGDKLIRARRFVIATGSRPVIPEIPGLDDVPYFTNETIFENNRKLTHLVIIGGGAMGLELAQAYRRLGSEVTVVEPGRMLPGSDPELVEIALRRLREEGVSLREGTQVASIQARSMGIGVVIRSEGGEETLDVSHILVAEGRRPALEGLELEKAGIRFEKDSAERLKLARNLRTTNRRVYAIGDAAGGPQFTHVASYQAELVVRNALLGLPARENRDVLPFAIFTDPEIAEIGITEENAKKRLGKRYRVTRWSFAENDRARAMRQDFGVAKMITDDKGKILGAGIVGPQAGELIGLFSFAIANRLSARHLLAFIAPYPTLSDIANRLGVAFYKDQSANPWLQRILALNRLLP